MSGRLAAITKVAVSDGERLVAEFYGPDSERNALLFLDAQLRRIPTPTAVRREGDTLTVVPIPEAKP